MDENCEPFLVGEWHVEPSLHRIRRDTETVQLEPRVMRLLVCLATVGGRVVSRNELLDVVWDDVLVNDEAVSRAVSELRKALRDDTRSPRYIQTIRKSGYRLLPPLTGPAPDVPGRGPQGSPRNPTLRTAVAMLALLALLTAVGMGWLASRETASPAAAAESNGPWIARTLTAFPGREIDPAIDPSGRRAVFAWDAGNGSDYNLYVQMVGSSAAPLRVTHTAGFEGHPAWSPDGASIAFVRASGDRVALWRVPATGGAEVKLRDLDGWSFGVDWFPDGQSIALSQRNRDGPARLVRLDLATGMLHALTDPGPRVAGDYKPAVSPDGAWIAFVRSGRLDWQDVFVVAAEGSADARQLSRSGGRIRGVDWTPTGGAVVYATDLAGGYGLWRATLDDNGHSPEWLPLGEQDIYNPVVGGDGRLVFESISFDRNLWSVSLDAGGGAAAALPVAIVSTRQESLPDVSPDGLRVAFVSTRGGSPAVWEAGLDGSALRQVSTSDYLVATGPLWSPDGSWLAVSLAVDGYATPFVLRAGDGYAVRIAAGPAHAIPVAWSRDGRRLYLASDREGTWDVFVMDCAGTECGPAVDGGGGLRRVTEGGGLTAAESADGRVLYYSRPDEPTLFRLAVGERGEGRPVGPVGEGPTHPWRLIADQIYYANRSQDGFRLFRLDLPTGKIEALPTPAGFGGDGFALLPDGSRMIYSRMEDSKSDLMFVDGVL